MFTRRTDLSAPDPCFCTTIFSARRAPSAKEISSNAPQASCPRGCAAEVQEVESDGECGPHRGAKSRGCFRVQSRQVSSPSEGEGEEEINWGTGYIRIHAGTPSGATPRGVCLFAGPGASSYIDIHQPLRYFPTYLP